MTINPAFLASALRAMPGPPIQPRGTILKPGTVIGGFKFVGTDASDPKSWKRVYVPKAPPLSEP